MTTKYTLKQQDVRDKLNSVVGVDQLIDSLKLHGVDLSSKHILPQTKTKLFGDSTYEVMVYHSTLDSDQGDWRRNSTRTSWYNEQLNTNTRGSTRAFPTVAILLLDDRGLTIYDGDQPDVPMWMQFECPSTYAALPGDIRCVTARNGKIFVGNNEHGLNEIDFILDRCLRHRADSTQIRRGLKPGTIVDRNMEHEIWDTSADLGLVSDDCNGVDATILKRAPWDAERGLPVVTIAAIGRDENAGTGGLTVHGGLYNNTFSNAAIDGLRVAFTPDDMLVATMNVNYSPSDEVIMLDPYSSFTEIRRYRWNTACCSTNAHNTNGGLHNALVGTDDGFAGANYYDNNNKHPSIGKYNVDLGGTIWDDMYAFITPKYTTGWMHSNCRVATCMDNTTGVIGTKDEMLHKSLFTSNFDGWTLRSGSLNSFSIETGMLRLVGSTGEGNGYDHLYKDFVTRPGQHYSLSVDVTYTNNYPWVAIYDEAWNLIWHLQMHTSLGYTTTTHNVNVTIQASTPITRVVIGGNSPHGDGAYFDNLYFQSTSNVMRNGESFDINSATNEPWYWDVSNTGTITRTHDTNAVDPADRIERMKILSTDFAGAWTNINNLTPGEHYTYFVEMDLGTRTGDGSSNDGYNSFDVRIKNASDPNSSNLQLNAINTGGGIARLTATFEASAESHCFQIVPGEGGQKAGECFVNRVEVRPAVKSYTGNKGSYFNNVASPMIVGNIRKQPVNTGCDVMAYTNFKADPNMQENGLINVLKWPDLQNKLSFTDPWYMMFWQPTREARISIEKFNTNATYNNTIVSMSSGISDGNHALALRSPGTPLTNYTDPQGDARFITLIYDPADTSNTYAGVDGAFLVYYGDRMVKKYYPNRTFVGAEADLIIGAGSYNNTYSTGGWSNGAVSMLRIGNIHNNELTQQKIQKIYRDEAPLFEPGAKGTIPDNNWNVLGLSFDPTTKLLHAGNQNQRCVFDGFQMIEQHDNDCVRIDACGGFVIER